MLAAHQIQNMSNGLPWRSDSGIGLIPLVSMLQTLSLAGPASCVRSTSVLMPSPWFVPAGAGFRPPSQGRS